ncbi:hypothetical protein GBAR_LOCUS21631 [Geodia barretti]|uniref:Uncharacterized protein n=1 Tax=Geodia barretti TaxID=519541 RepID=A0AA35X5E1_GEOBA|nr:hypothetical protein GBAR_LOCUS21631 [Geodia barretti]
MKKTMASARVKLQKQAYFQRRIKLELDRNDISLPFDIPVSDEDLDFTHEDWNCENITITVHDPQNADYVARTNDISGQDIVRSELNEPKPSHPVRHSLYVGRTSPSTLDHLEKVIFSTTDNDDPSGACPDMCEGYSRMQTPTTKYASSSETPGKLCTEVGEKIFAAKHSCLPRKSTLLEACSCDNTEEHAQIRFCVNGKAQDTKPCPLCKKRGKKARQGKQVNYTQDSSKKDSNQRHSAV